ncbi:MAG TPA: pyruvate kinase [Geminicoccaceae bacterium]
MRRRRRAKILATLGPSSASPERIAELVDAGADAFRFNFSHGTHEQHQTRYDAVRLVEQERGRPIAVVMDVQGPKLRVGEFRDGSIQLRAGQRFRLDLDDAPGDQDRVGLPHPEIFAAVDAGAQLLLDDGKIRLEVQQVDGRTIDTTVRAGGILSDHKGVNVPDVVLPVSPLTDKDRSDLAFGLEMGADWVALSFVQRPEDVAEARRLTAGRAALMSKIEKPAAIERLTEIIELSDGIMIARGDLGVEMPPEDVPSLQKKIIRASRDAGKPVVVATQMLESMIRAPAPTRAEASDVATAAYDGADAMMLSAETAVGDYPVEAVAMMDRILRKVEADPLYRTYVDAYHAEAERTAPDAITLAAREVASTMRAGAIVTYTTTGSTALRAARERPEQPILGLINRLSTARRLALLWGVHGVVADDVHDIDEMVAHACEHAVAAGFAEVGTSLVITAGVPFGTPGATNLLRIAWVTRT